MLRAFTARPHLAQLTPVQMVASSRRRIRFINVRFVVPFWLMVRSLKAKNHWSDLALAAPPAGGALVKARRVASWIQKSRCVLACQSQSDCQRSSSFYIVASRMSRSRQPPSRKRDKTQCRAGPHRRPPRIQLDHAVTAAVLDDGIDGAVLPFAACKSRPHLPAQNQFIRRRGRQQVERHHPHAAAVVVERPGREVRPPVGC